MSNEDAQEAGLARILTAEELAEVTSRSNWRGAWVVICQYAITVSAFALAYVWPGIPSFVLGTLILGGRQLGFFVLTHETGHRTLFKSRALNAFVGDWLMSPMDLTNGRAYMREHLLHHRAAGTDEDPDLANYRDYPITHARLRRKLLRDVTGRTGWKIVRAKWLALSAFAEQPAENRGALLRGVGMNALLFTVLLLLGAPWLYLMWLGAIVVVGPLVARIRQVAEHAAVPELNSDNPLLNTRTVLANPLERLFLCPHQVNYHVEHHLAASVPIYRLRRLHELLKAKGYYDEVECTHGYAKMLREVTTAGAV